MPAIASPTMIRDFLFFFFSSLETAEWVDNAVRFSGRQRLREAMAISNRLG